MRRTYRPCRAHGGVYIYERWRGFAFLHSCSSNDPAFDIFANEDESGKRRYCYYPIHIHRSSCLLLLPSIELRIITPYQSTTTQNTHKPARMNTTSLVLTGRPASGLTITLKNPNKGSHSQTNNTLSSQTDNTSASQTDNVLSSFPFSLSSRTDVETTKTTKMTPPTPPNTPTSSPALRPKHLRRMSSDSTGWYLDAGTPSLQDFEARGQTLVKRFEKFANAARRISSWV